MAKTAKYAIGDNIKRLRLITNLTQAQLAHIAGVTENAISKWETGRVMPRMGPIERICACYGINKLKLIEEGGLDGMKLSQDGRIVGKSNDDQNSVPLYGSVAAGTPAEMLTVEEYVQIPRELRIKYPDAFLLRVSGQSMNLDFQDGSLVLVDPCPTIDFDNWPYVVAINGSTATVKRVHKLSNGIELIPNSTDPTFRSRVFDYADDDGDVVTVIGRVVWDCKPVHWSY